MPLDPRLEAVLPGLPAEVQAWAVAHPDRAQAILADRLPDVLHFASGSNHPGEVRGFASIGYPVGVVAPLCIGEAGSVAAGCEAALAALAGTGLPVFVDSGAFSEVVVGPAGVRVVHPMEHAAWVAVLGLYLRLARVLGSALYVVAPDRIGDQGVTLERLTRYRSDLLEIRAAGANVLVPLQRGDLDLAAFHAQVEHAIGQQVPGWIPAIPMKKAATSDAALRAYVEQVRPPRLHLLGLGPRRKRAVRVLALLAASNPSIRVTMDSVLITAAAGRTSGRGGGPRRLTHAQDVARAEVTARAAGLEGAEERVGDLVADPAAWLSRYQLRKVGVASGLTAPQARAFVRTPHAFVASYWTNQPGPEQTPPHRGDALVAKLHALAEAEVYGRRTTAERKERGIRYTFGEVPIRQDREGMAEVLGLLVDLRASWVACRRAERAAQSALGKVSNEEILVLADVADTALADLLERKNALTRRAPWIAGWYVQTTTDLRGCEDAGTWAEWVVTPQGSVWYEDEAACLDALIEAVEQEISS